MPGVLHSATWPDESRSYWAQWPGAAHDMNKLVVVLLLLLVYLQYRLWFGNGSLPDVWQLHREVEAQREENIHLRERNDALNAEVLDLQQGHDAIEERAREDLGMIKRGETYYQIVE